MALCNDCGKSCDKYTDHLKCSSCDNSYHISCQNVSLTQFEAIRGTGGSGWFCSLCRGGPADFSSQVLDASVAGAGSSVDPQLERRLADAIARTVCTSVRNVFRDELASLRAEIADLRIQNRQLSESLAALQNSRHVCNSDGSSSGAAGAPTYAGVTARSVSQSIVIRPKKSSQPVAETKSDILKNIDPLNESVRVDKIRTIRNGGVVVGCQQATEFKKIAAEKLSEKYDVHQLKTLSPSIRVVGMSDCVGRDLVVPYLLKQNEAVFSAESECKLVSFSSTKRSDSLYQATLQLDVATYERALKAGHVLVGFDACSVYDAVSPVRCFKCNGFSHTSKYCRGKLSCPRCGGSHGVKDCGLDGNADFKCINCIELNTREGSNHAIDHAAWDSVRCTAMKLVTDKLKSDLFGISQ